MQKLTMWPELLKFCWVFISAHSMLVTRLLQEPRRHQNWWITGSQIVGNLAQVSWSNLNSDFFLRRVKYLSHIVSKMALKLTLTKHQKWGNGLFPNMVKKFSSSLPLPRLCQLFIKGFAQIAKPLHKLTERFSTPIQMSAYLLHQSSSYPDFEKPFILDTDSNWCCAVTFG